MNGAKYMKARGWGGLAKAWFGFTLLAITATARAADATPEEANAVENISFSGQGGGKVVLMVSFKRNLAELPAGFTVNSPPRIALDLPNTVNGLDRNTVPVGEGDLRSVSVVQSGTRTRLVLNLLKVDSYETRLDGKNLVVTLQGGTPTSASGSITQRFAEAKPGLSRHQVRNIDFRRGPNGEGRIVIDLSDSGTGIDIRRQGRSLLVDFLNTTVAREQLRKLDVMDFGTPVRAVDTLTEGENVRVAIEPVGNWEHSAYQAENQFIIEISRVTDDPNKLVQGPRDKYNGDKLSLNFQNVEIRSVLQVIADFTGLNIIASDTVTGSITLRLKDVPWDQALDIILQSKNLTMRRNGTVVLIAPSDEVANKDKFARESQAQLMELEQTQTESIQLNYQKGEDVVRLLANDKQSILSKRGHVSFDPRTNILFVEDTGSKLEEIRKLIQKIDVAVRQVMIEARIVVADDTFSRQLGIRLGTQNGFKLGGTNAGVSGNFVDSSTIAGGARVSVPSTPGNLNVNLPTSGTPDGQLALTLLNIGSGNLINIELSALEADKRGKVVSSPRVITADKQKATIEQGTEIPYQQASSSGATNVSFKPAVLSLAVTPRITPDGRVIMDLEVKKDSIGDVFNGVPSINTRKVVTQIQVEDGETAVIGGIYETTTRNDTDKVPLLGDIPYLGNLFKRNARQDDKTELLIFITPKVLKDTLTVR